MRCYTFDARFIQSMETKVHFLAIPQKEFAKILVKEELEYLNTITGQYRWNHFGTWKITITPEYPHILLGQLIIHGINYERTLINLPFSNF